MRLSLIQKVMVLMVLVLPFLPAREQETILSVLAEAYIQVTVFVAVTYGLFLLLESVFKLDTKAFLKKHQKWQVLIAACMGGIPGCGGAIIVISQYVRGRLSFGAMVAVLIATMGDAAFLLLAKEPQTGFAIMVMGVVIGAVFGLIVDKIHGPDFMRPDESQEQSIKCERGGEFTSLTGLEITWFLFLVPGLFMALATAMQSDTDALLSFIPVAEPTLIFGVTGALLCILYTVFDSSQVNDYALSAETKSPFKRTICDTNFVTLWVILAFLLFELGVLWSGFDLKILFETWSAFVPFIAIVIGFIPGCGPQILVTSMYVSGIIPLSAQIGNAISNDGDALFPAMALAPKASILATLYSAIPAVILAYGWMIVFE